MAPRGLGSPSLSQRFPSRRERRQGDVSSHGLGRAIGRDELRVRLFERTQLTQQPVVLGVGDLRTVLEHIRR